MRLPPLSRSEAARIAIRAQGLDRRRLEAVPELLAHLGAVQLDTISVLARSHELVAHAPLGAVGGECVEGTCRGHGRAFDCWSEAEEAVGCLPALSGGGQGDLTRREHQAQRAGMTGWPATAAAVTACVRECTPNFSLMRFK